MKYIFDFDDVLFHNTEKLKPHMYELIEKAGIPKAEANEHYLKIRHEFVMRDFIESLFFQRDYLNSVNKDELYEDIMKESKNFINKDVLEIILKLGKENCFMVTHGETEHQMDKINRVGIFDLFSKIYVVQGSKKEAVEGICEQFKDEPTFFIDDKIHHLENLDIKKYPNLKTILYTGQDLTPLLL